MKKLWNGFLVSFAMYSKIPVPRADWTSDNMRLAMCFFPWIGVVIGLLQAGWFFLSEELAFKGILPAAVAAVIPLIVTGGIHMDGFLDTADAMSSWRDREKRLAILKDSNAGAFAIIMGAGYFVLYVGAASEMTREILPVFCLAYAVSRCFSALSVVYFPHANPQGTAAMFGENTQKRVVTVTMAVYLVLLFVAAFYLDPVAAFVLFAAELLTFWFYHHMAIKYFGGMTGDLAGFFVSTAELIALLALIVLSAVR